MTTEEQRHNSHPKTDHLKPWQFKKGQSGNPSGRPKGSISLKQWARNYIQTLTDEERLEFLEGMNKKDIWEMAEGKAEAHTTADIKMEVNDITHLSDDELTQLAEGGEEGTSEAGTSEETSS